MRKDHSSTTWISEPEQSPSEPEGVKFQAANRDLSRVAFTTTSQLTSEDPGGGGEALYIYTDSPDPKNEANLEFIYRNAQVTVDGMSEDASRGFFYSDSDRALFRWDPTGIHQVVELDPTLVDTTTSTNDDSLANPGSVHGAYSQVRVSGNGRSIAVVSTNGLTDAELGLQPRDNSLGFPALYVYDTESNRLVCASCPPSGEATTGSTFIRPHANADGGVSFTIGRNNFLTADGSRVFFSSPDALVPEDTNGRYDAYEYDLDTGRPHLLSSGRAATDSWFVTATPSGNDAFIITDQRLSAHDVDEAKDLYDARVGGGLPEPSSAQPQCEGDACQPPPAVLSSQSVGSEAFVGAKNRKARHQRCRSARKHRRGASKRSRKYCKRNANRHQHRADADRRTSK